MTRKNISDAMNQISDRHIEELMNFYEKQEEITIEKTNHNKITWLKWKSATVAAALALCVCLSGVTVLAATGKLQGFFQDIFGWDGAVVGTTYEQATDEITMNIIGVTDQLTVETVMLYPDKAPYHEFETFGIEAYQIIDSNQQVAAEGTEATIAMVNDGKVYVNISVDNLSEGAYKLIVNEMVGGKKADQPMILTGRWECEFKK